MIYGIFISIREPGAWHPLMYKTGNLMVFSTISCLDTELNCVQVYLIVKLSSL